MITHEGIAKIGKIKNAIVTSGTFDGVHIGHQRILKRVRNIADQAKGETVLITFWPHPRLVLYPEENNLRLLSTFSEKAKLLEQHGIDHLVKIPFTTEFSRLTSDEFIRKIVVEAISTRKLVIGYDHRFGRNREGSFEYLKNNAKNYGFEVEEISRQDVDDIGVSSTKIREALNEGNVHLAHNLLGRNYEINGTVMHGDRIGRTIGFPTANIHLPDPYKLIPGNGSYAAIIYLKANRYRGMINIGMRPTVDGKQLRIETNIFDFDQEIYGEYLKVEFVKRIRDEQKFDSVEALKKQLLMDRDNALEILEQY